MKYGWLVFLAVIGVSGAVHANETGRSCEDCSYQTAKLLAEQHAVPHMNCVMTPSPVEDPIEQCSSLPKKYFVLNETSREIYAFTVSHLNQKQPKQELVVSAADRTMTAAYRQQILRALDAKLFISQLLFEVSQPFNQTIEVNASQSTSSNPTTKTAKVFTAAAQATNASATAACANDPHVAALKAALDPAYKAELQKSVNREWQRIVDASWFKHGLRDVFAEFEITEMGVEAARGYPELTIKWEQNIRGKHFTHVYSKHAPHDLEESRLVWSMYLDKNATIKVELNQHASMIDIIKLADLLRFPEIAKLMKLSPCLAQELAKHSPKTVIEQANKEQVDRFIEIGDKIIGSHFDLDRDRRICQYTYLDRKGSILAQFLSLCP